MPQLIATLALWLSMLKMPWNGELSHEPASWIQLTTSLDMLAPSTTSRIAATISPTTTAQARRMRRAASMPPVYPGGSDGNHGVALPGPLDLLAGGHLERAADDLARLARIDHVVDHRVAGGDRDVDDLAVGLDELGLLGRGVVGLLDLPAHHDLDRALRPHDADLGARPGDDQVGLVGAPVHHVVARAIGLARDDRDLRHGRVGHGLEHLGSVADDPRLLDLRPDHEPGHVHQEQQRDVEGVAEVDEARGLVGRVVVEDPAQLLGL